MLHSVKRLVGELLREVIKVWVLCLNTDGIVPYAVVTAITLAKK